LRGVGAEDVFLAKYVEQSGRVRHSGLRVATPQALLESGQVLLPALLVAAVVFVGGHDIITGTLRPGQLVAFFGYASLLTTPLRTAVEWVLASTRAVVAARKILAVLSSPRHPESSKPLLGWPTNVDSLSDDVTGVHLASPGVTAIVSSDTATASELLGRLSRLPRDLTGGRLNGRSLHEFDLDEIRRNVVLSEIQPALFSGTLRYELSPHRDASDHELIVALEAASALDVLDSLDGGLDGRLDEKGSRALWWPASATHCGESTPQRQPRLVA
jgi:ABC-type multidrug transport system fused ATPase/permease subunit